MNMCLQVAAWLGITDLSSLGTHTMGAHTRGAQRDPSLLVQGTLMLTDPRPSVVRWRAVLSHLAVKEAEGWRGEDMADKCQKQGLDLQVSRTFFLLAHHMGPRLVSFGLFPLVTSRGSWGEAPHCAGVLL